MASGGWIGKVVSGLFNWGSKSYTPPSGTAGTTNACV